MPEVDPIYVAPSTVCVLLLAATGDRMARQSVQNLPDAVYDAALGFAHRAGLLRSVGQLTSLTRRGRRYLRANAAG